VCLCVLQPPAATEPMILHRDSIATCGLCFSPVVYTVMKLILCTAVDQIGPINQNWCHAFENHVKCGPDYNQSNARAWHYEIKPEILFCTMTNIDEIITGNNHERWLH